MSSKKLKQGENAMPRFRALK
ncbi:MAG: hypothetical protein QOG83_3447, partial [Alphaproteobacteria bacterium]|nr:hypothetical protein [Alphaproteobacteria bacterium]